MRFEVPQFIEVEDKIVGPFTWKQFVYLAGGGGILVALFLSTSFLVFLFIGVPIGALAGFLAFHQINNRPFSIFLESMVNYFRKSRLYLWHREKEQSVLAPEDLLPENQQTLRADRSRLSSLSEKLDYYTLEK